MHGGGKQIRRLSWGGRKRHNPEFPPKFVRTEKTRWGGAKNLRGGGDETWVWEGENNKNIEGQHFQMSSDRFTEDGPLLGQGFSGYQITSQLEKNKRKISKKKPSKK